MIAASKNVLYISYDGMTDPLGQSQVIPYISGLADEGYNYTLLSFEKKERFEKSSALIRDILSKKNITWVPLFYTKRPPVLSTVWDVARLIRKAAELNKEQHFSIVHCRSYISALAGLELKRKQGVRFIFDMRGFWADERVEGNIWNLKNPFYKYIYRFFKGKEKDFFTEADYTISLTANAEQEIHSWDGLGKIPIQVIPCCADLSLFDYHSVSPDALAAMKKELGIAPDDLIINYLGSIGTWYMVDEMFDFFNRLLQVKPHAKFLFITADAPDLIYSAAARRRVARDKLIIRAAARAEVPVLLACSSLSLFFIRPTFSKKASSPTKQGEIMGMGLPLICNSHVGDTDTIVEHTGCGMTIGGFNNSEYDQAISRIDSIMQLDRAQIRAGAEQYYSLKSGIKKYLSVYQTLLKQ